MREMERHAALPVVLTLLFLACDAELAAVAQNGLGPAAAASTPPGDEPLQGLAAQQPSEGPGAQKAGPSGTQLLQANTDDTAVDILQKKRIKLLKKIVDIDLPHIRPKMFSETRHFAVSNWSQNLEDLDLDTFLTKNSNYINVQNMINYYAEKQDNRSTDDSRGILAKPRCNRTDGVGMDLDAPLPHMQLRSYFDKSRDGAALVAAKVMAASCRKGVPLMFKNGTTTGRLCATEVFTGNVKRRSGILGMGIFTADAAKSYFHVSVSVLHLAVHVVVGVYVGRLGNFKAWLMHLLRLNSEKEMTAADIYLQLKITPTAKDVTVNVTAMDSVRMRTNLDKMVLANHLNAILNLWIIYLAELFGETPMQALMFYFFFLGKGVFQFFADKAVMGQGSLKQMMSSQGFTHAAMYALACFCHIVISYNVSTLVFLALTIEGNVFLRPWSRAVIASLVDAFLSRVFLNPVKERWVYRTALYKDIVTDEWVPTLRRRSTVLMVYVIFSMIVNGYTGPKLREAYTINHCRMVYQKFARPYIFKNESFGFTTVNELGSTIDYVLSGHHAYPPDSIEKLEAWQNGSLEIKPVCELLGYREMISCSRTCRSYGGLGAQLLDYIKENEDVSFSTIQQQVQRLSFPQEGVMNLNNYYRPMMADPSWNYLKFAEEPVCQVLNSGDYCCHEAGEPMYTPFKGNQRAKYLHWILLAIQVVLNMGGIIKLNWLSFGNFAWKLSEEAQLHVLPKAAAQWNRDYKPKYLTADEFGDRYSRFEAYMFFKKALMVELAHKKNENSEKPKKTDMSETLKRDTSGKINPDDG